MAKSKTSKEIKITCDCAENYHIDEFINLQGELKSMSDESYGLLKNSIMRFGFRFPIFYVLLDSKKYILDGHGRLYAIKKMVSDGFTFGKDNKLPAVRISAKDRKEAKEVLLAMNSKYGEMTTEGLHDFLEIDGISFDDISDFFKPSDFSIEDFKETISNIPELNPEIDDGEGEKVFDDEDSDGDDEEIPEVINPVIKKGDIIKLGKHRLMCGNSQDGLDIALLFDGNKANCMFTDPPYNYVGKNKLLTGTTTNAIKELKEQEWDEEFNPDKFLDLAKEFLQKDCTMYICTSHHLAGQIWEWMGKWADYHGYCVWSKINPMPSMMKRHWTWDSELVCYATKGKHTFNFPEEGHAPSTWRLNKSQRNEYHPTQKPVNVPTHAILHSTNKSDIVVDFFGGSGSTMLACEAHDRVCYMMEISEKYAQVTIERYVKYTGNSKIIINGKKVDWFDYKSSMELQWQRSQ